MPRSNVQKPLSVIITDDTGKFVVEPATVPPTTGVTEGVPVYANLGSEVIAVEQVLNGAAFFGTNQASISGAALLIAARPTRRSCIVTNTDSTVAIYVGAAGVTTSTGEKIAAGNSLTIPSTAPVYCVAASGTVVVTYAEAWD